MLIEKKRSIVRESIKSIVCIDDDYVYPYESRKKELSHVDYKRREIFSKKIYDGMAINSNCEVKIIPYRSDSGFVDISRNLYCKDLLVLDWELNNPHNIKIPLQIIDMAITQNVKYICIYTNERNTASIESDVNDYFCFDNESINMIAEEAKKYGITSTHFYKYAEMVERKAISYVEIGDLLNKEYDEMGIHLEYKSSLKNINNWRKLYRKWNNRDYYPETHIERSVNEIVLKNDKILRIDNTYIMIFNKDLKGTGIKEKDIVNKITDLLIHEPNSILNLIWIQYTKLIQERLNAGGDYFFDLDWKTFAYYSYSLSEGYSEREMRHFLSDIFMKKLSEAVVLNEKVLDQDILRELNSTGRNQRINKENIKEYMQLNSYLNTNQELSTAKHKITFGDILKTDNDVFYLCISCKCSCAERKNESNTRRDFFFVRGDFASDELKTFKDAEKGNYSFIRYIDKKGTEKNKIVHWGNSIISIHFENRDVYKGAEIVGHTDKDINFSYVCNIVSEYAQRMANSAYSYENRVGVSFANSYCGKKIDG